MRFFENRKQKKKKNNTNKTKQNTKLTTNNINAQQRIKTTPKIINPITHAD